MGCPWDERACVVAAGTGKLECLKYAHEMGCPFDDRVLEVSEKNGHKECSEYARLKMNIQSK
jgi:hypothetical protein